MQDVKRIEHNLADRRSVRAMPVRSPRRREDPDDLATDDGDFTRPGVQHSVLRKLRTGRISIEAELDLHGHTVAEAERELRAFVRSQFVAGRRAVRVIHGKGIGSPEGKSVLKEKVRNWLRQNDAVLAFCTAGPDSGGSGAVHVLLKAK